MALSIKKSGSWKTASKVYIKKNGTWREANHVYIKKNDIWHPIFFVPPQIPANPYTSFDPVYFDTWGIDLNDGNGDGWNMSVNWQAFYSRFYSQYEFTEKIKSEPMEQSKVIQYLIGLTGSETNFSSGSTMAAYFFTPPLAGWSDKQCYIKNNNSWYELVNAKNVDSGWYKLSFNGSSFSCSK